MATLDRMTPVLLAFDTSTEALAVALQGPGGRRSWNGDGGAQASALLLPTVQRLLDEAGLGLGQVDAIAFGCGPGAFTGLRTACSVAQGLALGADKPVLPLDSLLIVAEDARATHDGAHPLEVRVAMDARMGEVYAARYRWSGQAWQVLEPPGLWEPQAWLRACGPAMASAPQTAATPAWAGSGLPLLLEPRISGPHACADRAGALLRLADQAWHQGGAVPAEQALPVYLRDKVALTTAERQALKGAA